MHNDDIVIYNCKDGRSRVYIKETKKIMSYPKYLMEKALGRSLSNEEQVHHIDNDYTNNSIDNLEIKQLGIHQKEHKQKYFDKEVECCICGKKFIITALQLKRYYSNRSRNNKLYKNGFFCSKKCVGIYGKQQQMLKYKNNNKNKYA